MKTRFRERDPRLVGVIGVLVVAVLLATALSSGSLYRSLTSASYSAVFTDAGGLTPGAEVRIGGLAVGEVTSVDLERGKVRVGFSVQGPGNLGDLTRAGIRTATPLGVKFLAVQPSGRGQLDSGAEIPLSRTSSPYDLAQVLGQLTQQSSQLDTRQLGQALDTVSTTLQNTPDELRTTLDGLNRLTKTVSEQDQALLDLLDRANTVTGVLAQRNRDLSRLFDDGNLLLAELNSRRELVEQLLVTTTSMLDELTGLVHDNQQQLRPALDRLRKVLDMLNADNELLGTTIQGLNIYSGSLGESVGGGPWFYGFIPDLPPTNIAPLLPDVLKAVHP
ncbi:MCE family protein [Saccharopolyspora sp. HNM0983]|uniref:MCE family protein n=1 Tax=Saccharopolyspora montiporae TaxID=2781240 RepID=A0A929B6T9_9PSEU|nr:MCE family protein [Saccharopolyspora sp. HNM0983]MBE9373321.1 MCE family protein [Saccharopolyspora sp. HNM0983]